MPMDSEQHPIFVVGTGRSGTTLLRMMLCAHPRIYLTHEASFYVWQKLAPPKLDGEAYLRHFLQTFSYRWLGLDPATWIDEVPRPLERDHAKALYTAIMRAKAAQHGKVRWGDKTPSHANHLGAIFADYPGARVVRIVRDPRGVVRSLQRMPWASRTISGGTLLCDREHQDCAPFVDQILQVRLEDLLDDPRAVMTEVLDFVGEDWSEQVLDHPAHGPGLEDMPPVPWFAGAARHVSKPGTPSWTKADPVDIRLMERLNRKSMAAFGYEVAALDSEPSSLAVLGRWLGELPQFALDMWVFLRMAVNSRDPSAHDDNLMLHKLNPPAWDQYPGFEMPKPPPLPEGWEQTVAR